MGKIVSFKKLDFSMEAEEITKKAFLQAFWPLRATLIISISGFLLFFFMGYGSLLNFINSDVFKYVLLALFITAIWLVAKLKWGLICPNCKHSFFKFTSQLEIKPRSCPNCKVIFIKKTHPVEDDYDFSREFYLLKIEIERRVDLAIFYLVVGLFCFLYLIYPVFSNIIGSKLTLFIVLPAVIFFMVKNIIARLETRCPSCQEFIKWTELKPTEISKFCPHCDAQLVK
ncbi:MAG: hypothetical protein AB1782_15495 [Cyanobacteriota bacterium]